VEKEKIWEIILTKPAVKIYDKSNKEMQRRLDRCFEEFDRCFEELEKNPLYGNNIMPLTGKLKGLYRYRVGDWRIIYRIFKEYMLVEIIAILTRGMHTKKGKVLYEKR